MKEMVGFSTENVPSPSHQKVGTTPFEKNKNTEKYYVNDP